MLKNYERESQLVNGYVAAGKPCPYKGECGMANTCTREQYMNNEMSCGAARAYDMIYRSKK